jgi:glycosyltransferase involved in cell wall biosynthesis
MKIAILTSGILPVPAVLGGAVENLIDFYLEYNNRHKMHDITVYSVANPKTKAHPALQSDVNHYCYIDTYSYLAKIRIKLFAIFYSKSPYYHHSIAYYLEQSVKHLIKQSYDLILIENRPAYVLRLRQVTQAKIILHLHNEKMDNDTKDFHYIYKSVSRIITVSDYIGNCIKSFHPGDTKCLTVNNGIDIDAFSYQRSPIITRKRLGLSEKDFVLLFSGRISREKGFFQLLDAMLHIQPQPYIKLLFLGSPFYGNAKTKNEALFFEEIKAKVDVIKDKIVFTGYIPYEQMPDYLSISDVSITPSVWDDPFPTTVLEAQAMGKPIIATRRGGIPEEVSEKNAILLETDDHFVEHLAQAIIELYYNPRKRKSMADESIKRATIFNKDTYAKNFFEALEK